MRSTRLQQGLSLVELMIAMALSMLLMLGAMQMFLSSKQTYVANSALSRVQESGRFAMNFISYDLRNAGFRGECLSPINALTASANDPRYDLNAGIRGWEAQTNIPTWPDNFSTEKKAATDSIVIKHAAVSAGSVNTANTISADAASIPMASVTSSVTNGAYVVLSNAQGCDMFKSGTNTSTAITKAGAGNTGNFSQSYFPEITKVLLFQSHQYFIKNGASGTPSLYRARWSDGSTTGVIEEMVEGIFDLQLEYGLGTGAGSNRAAANSAFVKANAVTDWGNVVAVKVRLLALGDQINASPELQSYDREKGLICKRGDAACAVADTIDIPDRRLAQVFTSTISLRNQLP